MNGVHVNFLEDQGLIEVVSDPERIIAAPFVNVNSCISATLSQLLRFVRGLVVARTVDIQDASLGILELLVEHCPQVNALATIIS